MEKNEITLPEDPTSIELRELEQRREYSKSELKKELERILLINELGKLMPRIEERQRSKEQSGQVQQCK